MSWISVNSGLELSGATTALAVKNDEVFSGGSGEVFCSTNNGASWTSASSGLTYVTYKLFVSGSNLIAGTQGVIFLSINDGEQWTHIDSGLANDRGNCFAM